MRFLVFAAHYARHRVIVHDDFRSVCACGREWAR